MKMGEIMITKDNNQELIRDKFVFNYSFYDAISVLPDSEKLALYEAICAFGLFDIESKFDNIYLQATFSVIKENIKVSCKRRDISVNNGKKGGAPKKSKNAAKKTEEKDQ